MSILSTTPGGSVRKSGRLISFTILMNFEPRTAKIRRYYKRVLFIASQLSIAHKPSDGGRRGRVLFFDIGTPKTFQVYPPAIMFRITSCDRLPAKTIKPFEESRIPHLQICPNPHRLLRTDKKTPAQRCIRKANSNREQYISMFQTFQ